MAVADGKYAWLSQHIGDMDDLATLSAFDAAQQHLQELTAVAPEVLVADAHPLYRSTAWATPQRRGAPGPDRATPPRAHRGGDGRARPGRLRSRCSGSPSTERVTDPTAAVWGGEVLLANYKGYQRLAQLKYVPLAGGDISVLRPYRMALAHLWAAGIAWDAGSAAGGSLPRRRTAGACATSSRRVSAACRRPAWAGCSTRCPHSPASGRWWRTKRRRPSSWRACRAASTVARTSYAFDVDRAGQTTLIDPTPVLHAVVRDQRDGVPAGSDRRAVPPRGRRSGRRPRRRGTGRIANRRAVRRRVPERPVARN